MKIYVDYGNISIEHPQLPYTEIQRLGNNAKGSLEAFFPGEFEREQSDLIVNVKGSKASMPDLSAFYSYGSGAVALYPEHLIRLGYNPMHVLAHEAGHHVYANLMNQLGVFDLDAQHQIIKEAFAEMLGNILLSHGDEALLKAKYLGILQNPYLKQPLFGAYRRHSYPNTMERVKDALLLQILSSEHGLRKVATLAFQVKLPILQYYGSGGDILTNLTHLLVGWSYYNQFRKGMGEHGVDLRSTLDD